MEGGDRLCVSSSYLRVKGYFNQPETSKAVKQNQCRSAKKAVCWSSQVKLSLSLKPQRTLEQRKGRLLPGTKPLPSHFQLSN